MRGLLTEATTLLHDVYQANGMNRTFAQQYDILRRKVDKFRKSLKVPRPQSAVEHQNEIMEDLKNQLERVRRVVDQITH